MKANKYPFQENYEQGKSFCSKDLWQKIETKLEEKKKKRRKYFLIGISRWAAVFLLLFCLCGGFYIFITKESTTKNFDLAKANPTDAKNNKPVEDPIKSIAERAKTDENNQNNFAWPTKNSNEIQLKEQQNFVEKQNTLSIANQIKPTKIKEEKKPELTPMYEDSKIEDIRNQKIPEIKKYVNANDLLVSAEIENYMEDQEKQKMVKVENENPERNKKTSLEINVMGFDVSNLLKKK